MNSYTLPRWYVQARKGVVTHFNTTPSVCRTVLSPDGIYSLEIQKYPESNFSRGIVRKNRVVIADIKRNEPDFWYCWVSQKDRKLLLCGEDTQGYSVIDLQSKTTSTYIDPKANAGLGFTWEVVKVSPSGNKVAVQGSYLHAGINIVIYSLTDGFPLPKIKAIDSSGELTGWITDNFVSFILNNKETTIKV